MSSTAMTTCTSCGHANLATAAFCGSCSAFLEWSGAPAPTATAVPPARLPEEELERVAPQRVASSGPSDHFCGSCGAGNASGRHYCRRCGSALADAVVVAVPADPWWRRFWPRRTREPLGAGERPESWQRFATSATEARPRRRRWHLPDRLRLGKLALPLCILSFMGFGIIGPVRAAVVTGTYDVYHAVKVRVAPTYVPVSAVRALASSTAPGHPSGAAIDQNTATWWAEGGRGTAARLTVSFDHAVDIARIAFHNGAPGKDFPLQPRARSVRVVLGGPGALTVTKDLQLVDTPDLQHYAVKAESVRTVSVIVRSVYAGQRGSSTSMTEVEFLTVR